ncbi:MAG: AAA family ATPase, partial [Acidimicrobiia bacterium]
MSEIRPQLPTQLRAGSETAFVGRRQERRELARYWDEVVSGRRRAVFIGGEPGAGKTRLAGELATACYEDGAIVLAGSNTRDFGYPLQPFVEMLDRLFSEPTALEIVGELDTSTVANLALLSPQLARRSEVEPAAPSVFDDPGALLNAVAEVTRVLTGDAAVVMVLDNLHWAGPQTRQLLRALVTTSYDRRLFIVATHRTTAPDHSQELTRSIADLYGLAGVSRIDLAGLDTDEIAAFLTAAGGATGTIARQTAAILRDYTGGNPFFLEETWRDLERRGGIEALIAENLPTPRTVRDVLDLRLAALKPGTLESLGSAAIAGDDLDLDLLYDIGLDPAAVLSAVDDAIAHGLLHETGTGISFRHALTRQAVIDRIPRHERLRIHLDVALALERRGRQTPEAIAAIAHHYEQAAPLGHVDKAIEYLRLSAEASRRSLAHREAAAALDHAAAISDGSQALELRFEAAESHCRGNQREIARARYRELANGTDARIKARAAIGNEEASWED